MRARSRKSLERPGQAGEQVHPGAAPVAGGSQAAKDVRSGGIDAKPSDPLGRAALRESYGARSGETPEASGTPETVTGAGEKGVRRGGRAARRNGGGSSA